MERPHSAEIGEYIISRHDHIDETVYSICKIDKTKAIATYGSKEQFREKALELAGQCHREYITWFLYLNTTDRENARQVYSGQSFEPVV